MLLHQTLLANLQGNLRQSEGRRSLNPENEKVNIFFPFTLLSAELLGIHVKGRLTLSGEELETMDSLQLGDAIQQVKSSGYTCPAVWFYQSCFTNQVYP